MAEPVTITLILDSSNLDKSLSQLKAKLDGLGKTSTKTGKTVSSIGKDVKQATKSVTQFSQHWRMLYYDIRRTSTVMTGFFASGIAIRGFKAIINTAADAQESFAKFDIVFKHSMDIAGKATKDLTDNYRLAHSTAKKMMADTGNLLFGFGIPERQAARMSAQIQKMASDLANFTNYEGRAEGASVALTKAIYGRREMAKRLGLAITENAVKERMAALVMAGYAQQTKQATKALATFQIMQEQSVKAYGATARESSHFKANVDALKAALTDLAVKIGGELLGPATAAVKGLTNIVRSIESLPPALLATISYTGMAATGIVGLGSAAMATKVLWDTLCMTLGRVTKEKNVDSAATETNTAAVEKNDAAVNKKTASDTAAAAATKAKTDALNQETAAELANANAANKRAAAGAAIPKKAGTPKQKRNKQAGTNQAQTSVPNTGVATSDFTESYKTEKPKRHKTAGKPNKKRKYTFAEIKDELANADADHKSKLAQISQEKVDIETGRADALRGVDDKFDKLFAEANNAPTYNASDDIYKKGIEGHLNKHKKDSAYDSSVGKIESAHAKNAFGVDNIYGRTVKGLDKNEIYAQNGLSGSKSALKSKIKGINEKEKIAILKAESTSRFQKLKIELKAAEAKSRSKNVDVSAAGALRADQIRDEMSSVLAPTREKYKNERLKAGKGAKSVIASKKDIVSKVQSENVLKKEEALQARNQAHYENEQERVKKLQEAEALHNAKKVKIESDTQRQIEALHEKEVADKIKHDAKIAELNDKYHKEQTDTNKRFDEQQKKRRKQKRTVYDADAENVARKEKIKDKFRPDTQAYKDDRRYKDDIAKEDGRREKIKNERGKKELDSVINQKKEEYRSNRTYNQSTNRKAKSGFDKLRDTEEALRISDETAKREARVERHNARLTKLESLYRKDQERLNRKNIFRSAEYKNAEQARLSDRFEKAQARLNASYEDSLINHYSPSSKSIKELPVGYKKPAYNSRTLEDILDRQFGGDDIQKIRAKIAKERSAEIKSLASLGLLKDTDIRELNDRYGKKIKDELDRLNPAARGPEYYEQRNDSRNFMDIANEQREQIDQWKESLLPEKENSDKDTKNKNRKTKNNRGGTDTKSKKREIPKRNSRRYSTRLQRSQAARRLSKRKAPKFSSLATKKAWNPVNALGLSTLFAPLKKLAPMFGKMFMPLMPVFKALAPYLKIVGNYFCVIGNVFKGVIVKLIPFVGWVTLIGSAIYGLGQLFKRLPRWFEMFLENVWPKVKDWSAKAIKAMPDVAMAIIKGLCDAIKFMWNGAAQILGRIFGYRTQAQTEYEQSKTSDARIKAEKTIESLRDAETMLTAARIESINQLNALTLALAKDIALLTASSDAEKTYIEEREKTQQMQSEYDGLTSADYEDENGTPLSEEDKEMVESAGRTGYAAAIDARQKKVEEIRSSTKKDHDALAAIEAEQQMLGNWYTNSKGVGASDEVNIEYGGVTYKTKKDVRERLNTLNKRRMPLEQRVNDADKAVESVTHDIATLRQVSNREQEITTLGNNIQIQQYTESQAKIKAEQEATRREADRRYVEKLETVSNPVEAKKLADERTNATIGERIRVAEEHSSEYFRMKNENNMIQGELEGRDARKKEQEGFYNGLIQEAQKNGGTATLNGTVLSVDELREQMSRVLDEINTYGMQFEEYKQKKSFINDNYGAMVRTAEQNGDMEEADRIRGDWQEELDMLETLAKPTENLSGTLKENIQSMGEMPAEDIEKLDDLKDDKKKSDTESSDKLKETVDKMRSMALDMPGTFREKMDILTAQQREQQERFDNAQTADEKIKANEELMATKDKIAELSSKDKEDMVWNATTSAVTKGSVEAAKIENRIFASYQKRMENLANEQVKISKQIAENTANMTNGVFDNDFNVVVN